MSSWVRLTKEEFVLLSWYDADFHNATKMALNRLTGWSWFAPLAWRACARHPTRQWFKSICNSFDRIGFKVDSTYMWCFAHSKISQQRYQQLSRECMNFVPYNFRRKGRVATKYSIAFSCDLSLVLHLMIRYGILTILYSDSVAAVKTRKSRALHN